MKNFARKSLKSSNGITLIALVITIIVLLILAGISISMLSGKNGILQRTTDAKTNTDNAQIREKIQLAELAAISDGMGELEYTKLVSELTKQFGTQGTDWDISEMDENPWIITVGNITESINHKDIPIDDNPGILEGKGTQSEPYIINSIEDLVALSYAVNTGTNSYNGNEVILGRNLNFKDDKSYANANAKYKYTSPGCTPDENSTTTIKELMTDTNGNGFTPIGFSGEGFKGNFDGKGKSLTNLYIKGIAFNGLFGSISTNITIKNVKLLECNIKGNAPTGGIVGQSTVSLNISNCIVSGNIEAQAQAGGIIGQGNNVDIFNCHNEAVVLSKGAPAGGVVGTGGGIIEMCYNTGEVNTLNSGGGIAGILGDATADTKVYNCYNIGNIGEETTGMLSGGIVGNGNNKNVEIINCYNNGVILSECPAGGIIGGYTTSSIINCYNFNNVTSKNSPAGGIYGMGSNTIAINSCYNSGEITTNSTSPCGGIAGSNSTITNSYSTGKVSGTSEYTIGYIGGYGTIVDNTNKYKEQTPDIESSNAVKFDSNDEMEDIMDVEKFIDRMNNYDFTGNGNDIVINIWTIKNGYPVFL